MPDDKEAKVYTAERILSKRIRNGKTEYYIKWKGWAARWNTWEPEKHILDKLLIEDFNNRNRKNQKSKTLVRNSVNKRQTTIKNRVNNPIRARRLQSSSSSDISTSAIVSPRTNDENNDEDLLIKTNLDNDRTDGYKLRSSQNNDKPSLKESDEEEEEVVDDDNQSTDIEKPKLDESLKEYLWQPDKIPSSSSSKTTITEVTDQNGVTVLIRELNDLPISTLNRSPRILGYGNGGRGGRH